MNIVIASDHAGVDLKTILAEKIRELGQEVNDVGSFNNDPVDYPDFAEALGKEILAGHAERGILICGSGVGASVAANKIPGIRAGLAHDEYSAHQGVEHDDMNVLVLGARVVGSELSKELVERFLAATFSGESRHVRRLGKIKSIEQRYSGRG
jgi:ribose 5-phosphate isomerase B